MKNHLVGMFIGLAVGDALGRPIEGNDSLTVDGMQDGGPFSLSLPAGYWTDDTSMALCLADSLLEQGRYDSYDVMERYGRWAAQGYRSSTGVCFDIGDQVSRALADFESVPEVEAAAERSDRAGNGCIMRLAPVVIAALSAAGDAPRLSRMSGRETHYSELAEDATEMFGEMLERAVTAGAECGRKEDIYPSSGTNPELAWRLHAAASRSAEELNPTGFVVHTLEVALWAFMTTEDFAAGALKAVNLGGDADTIGAVYGQLAGAYYGLTGIPVEWRGALHDYEELLRVAEALATLKNLRAPRTRFAEDRESSPMRIGWSRAVPTRFTERDINVKPMLEPVAVPVDWVLSPAEVERLRDGYRAVEQEHRWNVVAEGDEVRILRSWSGYEMYRFTLESSQGRYQVSMIHLEQSPERYRGTSAEALDSLAALLRSLLR